MSTSTYLPLKSAFISTQGTAATGHIASDDIVTYEFLPATPANLAKLRPVIPAGFTRTAKPPVNLHG